MVRFLDWCHKHLSWHITIIEDIGSVINGPLLLLAAIIAGLNQITGGGILHALPWIGLGWAVLQIVGIDLQYMASARRLKDAFVLRNWGLALFWLSLTLLLAAPVTLANLTFTLQMMLGWTDAQAMQLISLTPLMIAVGRALLQAVLAFISAITRETRQPSVLSAASPVVVPPPKKGGKRAPTRTRSHTGQRWEQQKAERERRLTVVSRMLQSGNPISVGMVKNELQLSSNSQASRLLDEARTRYQAV